VRTLLVLLAVYASLSYALGAFSLWWLRSRTPPRERPGRGPVLAAWAMSPVFMGLLLASVPAAVGDWVNRKRKGDSCKRTSRPAS